MFKSNRLVNALNKLEKVQEDILIGIQEEEQHAIDLEEELKVVKKNIKTGERVKAFFNSVLKGEE